MGHSGYDKGMAEDSLPLFRYLPLSIHLETLGGLAAPLVFRGTPLPANRSQTFMTATDDQKEVEVRISMGESQLAAKNLSVGALKLGGIPARPRGMEIHVAFRVDATCSTQVTAAIPGTTISQTQTFPPPIRLDSMAIDDLLATAEASKEKDDRAIRGIEARNRAEVVLSRAELRLKEVDDDWISRALAALGLALQSNDLTSIIDGTDKLERLLSGDSLSFDDTLNDFEISDRRRGRSRTVSGIRISPFIAGAAARMTTATLNSHAVAPVTPHVVLGKMFGSGAFALDTQLCFVLMPFAETLRQVYLDHILPTVEAKGLRCQRADDIASISHITRDIWERINRARLLIADLTGQNSNVFYELGLSHALSKDVILVTQSMDFVPFDLKSIRCIVYEYTPSGMRDFEARLSNTIEAVLQGR
jgi:hypothetical protein